MSPNHLSILGIIHTAISILALFAAFYALFRDGKLDPLNTRGKIYIVLTVITCLTSLPIMKLGHPTAGHYVAILVLVLLPIGYYARSLKFLGKGGEYVQIIIMSTTLFFSFIPAIVETLTRLPISHPIADGPNAPVLQMGLLTLVGVYFVGTVYQLLKLRSKRRSASQPGNDMKLT